MTVCGRIRLRVLACIALALGVAPLAPFCGPVFGTAYDMVNTGEVTPLTALLTLVSLVLVVVGALGDFGLGVERNLGSLVHHGPSAPITSVVPVTAAAFGEHR